MKKTHSVREAKPISAHGIVLIVGSAVAIVGGALASTVFCKDATSVGPNAWGISVFSECTVTGFSAFSWLLGATVVVAIGLHICHRRGI